MGKRALIILIAVIGFQSAYANTASVRLNDSVQTRKMLIGIINTVVKASGSFEISPLGDLYTQNAVVADEQPPFSWNGPTAGAQWVNGIEKACKDLKIKKLEGKVGHITVYLQNSESIYVVVPVEYTGQIKGEGFNEDGVFTFVFRMEDGKWLIKSQVWTARRGM